MADYAIESIRNLALVGHGGTGKTTLVEHALNAAGATKRLGSVDQKNALLDFDEEEHECGHSIDTGLAHCDYQKNLIQFVDAPGYPDFFGAAVGALRAAETAVVVVSAGAGIEVNTRKMWAAAEDEGNARAVLISRMDAENVDFNALLAQIQEVFGSECVPFQLPVMSGGITGVVDVLACDGEGPDGVVGDPAEARNTLIESVVETDENLMERYLGDEDISAEEVSAACRKAIAQGAVVPVLCCAAEAGVGVEEFLDAAVRYLPSPADVPPVVARKPASDEEEEAESVEVPADQSGPVVAHVFKTVTDPFVGKMSFLRIFSGTIKADTTLTNTRTGDSEKLHQVMKAFGKDAQPVEEAGAGELIVVPKLEDLQLFDTLCEGEALEIDPPSLPTPMVSLALEPKSRGDEQRIGVGLEKLAQEDPTFQISRDAQTGELVASGMSTLHLEIILSRLKRRFNVEVDTKEPKIPYRETVTTKAESMYRHKKQTGGRGQFAEVWLRVAAQERGEGFEFVDAVVGGAIPHQYIPSVEKGIRETLDKGILAGYPVEDVQVELYDGKYHTVDSSDAAFKLAGSQAFRKAFREAKPVLLEPVVNVEITIPSANMGDISGDIVSRRGRIQGMDQIGDMQVVRATVPLAEVTRYATELNSITGGQGYFTMEFSHYDVVPSHAAEPIIAAAKKEEDEE